MTCEHSRNCFGGHGPVCRVCGVGHYQERRIRDVDGVPVCSPCIDWHQLHPVAEMVARHARDALLANREKAATYPDAIALKKAKATLADSTAAFVVERSVFGEITNGQYRAALAWLEAEAHAMDERLLQMKPQLSGYVPFPKLRGL